MTGFEYTAAVGMLYEDRIDDGLKCIQNIRDRYDGRKRSPFNEAECGHHYARAMASWAAVLAMTGFNYSSVEKSMTFAAKDGTFFWSNGYAWGSCCLKRSAGSMNKNDTFLLSNDFDWGISSLEESVGSVNVELSVLHGELPLFDFRLLWFGQTSFGKLLTIKAGEKIKFEVGR